MGVHHLFKYDESSIYRFACVDLGEVIFMIRDHLSRTEGVEFTEEVLDTMAGLTSNEEALQLAEALLAGREWRLHSNA